MDRLLKFVDFPARLLMSLLFLKSGVGKLMAIAGTQAYMESHGLPGILLYPAAVWEIGAGLLLLAGIQLKPLAILLAGWCLLTAAIFHTKFSDPNQMTNFLKNLTMAGSFLLLAKSGVAGSREKVLIVKPGSPPESQ